MSPRVFQLAAGYPEREEAPAPTHRPAVQVDLRRFPGKQHEHKKRTGFWAGRTKVAPGERRHSARKAARK